MCCEWIEGILMSAGSTFTTSLLHDHDHDIETFVHLPYNGPTQVIGVDALWGQRFHTSPSGACRHGNAVDQRASRFTLVSTTGNGGLCLRVHWHNDPSVLCVGRRSHPLQQLQKQPPNGGTSAVGFVVSSSSEWYDYCDMDNAGDGRSSGCKGLCYWHPRGSWCWYGIILFRIITTTTRTTTQQYHEH
jgi:hypothetical protein